MRVCDGKTPEKRHSFCLASTRPSNQLATSATEGSRWFAMRWLVTRRLCQTKSIDGWLDPRPRFASRNIR
jgi:hypothetical protein